MFISIFQMAEISILATPSEAEFGCTPVPTNLSGTPLAEGSGIPIFEVPLLTPEEKTPRTKESEVCEVCEKSFSSVSNLYKHMRKVHKLIKCTVVKCRTVLDEEEMATAHKHAFRDRGALTNYQARIRQQDITGTPMPEVNSYWNKQLQQNHQLPLQELQQLTNQNVTHKAQVPDTPSFILQQVHNNPPDLSTVSDDTISTPQMSPNELNMLQQLLHKDSVPAHQTTRDCQPLSLVQGSSEPGKTDVRIVSVTPKEDYDLSTMSKNELLKRHHECEEKIKMYSKKKEAIKRRLKMLEATELKKLKQENQDLRKKNALLEERLVAARDVRREADQTLRRNAVNDAVPIGTTLLRY